jgi:hypothetical protein
MTARWWRREGRTIVPQNLPPGENQGRGCRELIEKARLPTHDVVFREVFSGPNEMLFQKSMTCAGEQVAGV